MLNNVGSIFLEACWVIDFCELTRLIKTNTHCEHKDINKLIRFEPRECVNSITAYILEEKSYIQNYENIIERTGSEVNSDPQPSC